ALRPRGNAGAAPTGRSRPTQPPARGASTPAPPLSSGDFQLLQPSTTALERLLEQAGFLTQGEGEAGVGLARPVPAGGWTRWLAKLVRDGRSLSLIEPAGGQRRWIATARLDWFLALDSRWQPSPPPGQLPREVLPGDRDAIRQWLVEGRRRVEGERALATVVG